MEEQTIRSYESENRPGQSSMALERQVIGGYRLESQLGCGGMATVYKARHIDLGMVAALKILHNCDSAHVVRFQREARALAALSHQNISAVKRFDLVDGVAFLVAEYHPGKTLADALKTDDFSEQRLISIFLQICAGLAHAHNRGIIHRDLKPTNVLLTDDGTVKIIDFGIAKNEAEDGQLTQPGSVLGSPAYMSPEQCRGRMVDHRSDIYSLGCLMYEALAGKRPFRLKGFLLMEQHCNEKPPSFAEVAPERQISSQLEVIVLKALEKDPNSRYQSADEIITVLQEIVTVEAKTCHQPISHKIVAVMIGVVATLFATIFISNIANQHNDSISEQQLRAIQTECEHNKEKRFATISDTAIEYEYRRQFTDAEKIWQLGIAISPSADERAIFTCRLGLLALAQNQRTDAENLFQAALAQAIQPTTKNTISRLIAAARKRCSQTNSAKIGSGTT